MVVEISKDTLRIVAAIAALVLLAAAFTVGRVTAPHVSVARSYGAPAAHSGSAKADCPEYSSSHPFCGSKPGPG